jgi:hypothetical protein
VDTDPVDTSPEALGERIIGILGPGASRGLLDALTRSDEDRAELIARLHLRADGEWLAELLMDIESDSDGVVRLSLIGALLEALPPDTA